MRLSHVSYRVRDRLKAAEFFARAFKCRELQDLDLGGGVRCLLMAAHEQKAGYETRRSTLVDLTAGNSIPTGVWTDFHMAHSVIIYDGDANTEVGNWVSRHGGGLYSLAYEVFDVATEMSRWRQTGLGSFTTTKPIESEGMFQAISDPHPITGVVYELLQIRDPSLRKYHKPFVGEY